MSKTAQTETDGAELCRFRKTYYDYKVLKNITVNLCFVDMNKQMTPSAVFQWHIVLPHVSLLWVIDSFPIMFPKLLTENYFGFRK